MKRLTLFIIHLSLFISPTRAQEWTMQQCMQYAVTHSHTVKQAELELDNYIATRTGAIGRFLPEVDAGIGAQYNFGRAIDPETNGYTDVSTFYNGYQLSASLPLFDGFSRLHALRAAKAGVMMGRQALRLQQDQTALTTLQAWVNTAYYKGLVAMAEEKQREADLLLRQTQVMVEVGRKSAADLAQMEAQQAEAAYELTRQQNLLASALLELKKDMGFPLADSISCSDCYLQAGSFLTANWEFPYCKLGVSYQQTHPELLRQYYAMKTRLHEWRQARASILPSLSLSAGLSTTYFKTLHSQTAASFRDQLDHNRGEYVVATVSIPLFNRLQTVSAIRRAKNSYCMAREAYEQQQLELEKLSREARQDCEAYLKQAAQMEKKVEADSLAYQLTRRQFEEGLSTAIDLHTTGSRLLQSKATLLQCRLMAIVKEQLVRYYQGEQIWTE